MKKTFYKMLLATVMLLLGIAQVSAQTVLFEETWSKPGSAGNALSNTQSFSDAEGNWVNGGNNSFTIPGAVGIQRSGNSAGFLTSKTLDLTLEEGETITISFKAQWIGSNNPSATGTNSSRGWIAQIGATNILSITGGANTYPNLPGLTSSENNPTELPNTNNKVWYSFSYTLDHTSTLLGEAVNISFRSYTSSNWNWAVDDILVVKNAPAIVEPTVIVAPTSIDFGTIAQNADAAESILVEGALLEGDLTVSIEGTDAAAFTLSTQEISVADAQTEGGFDLGVTFNAANNLEIKDYSATVVISGGGLAKNVEIAVSGSITAADVTAPQVALNGI
jgi:hypothetical protein